MTNNFKLRALVLEYFRENRTDGAFSQDIAEWLKKKYGIEVRSVKIANVLKKMGFMQELRPRKYGKRWSYVNYWRKKI